MPKEIKRTEIKKSLDIIQAELKKIYKLIEPEPVKEQRKTISQVAKGYEFENRARRRDELL